MTSCNFRAVDTAAFCWRRWLRRWEELYTANARHQHTVIVFRVTGRHRRRSASEGVMCETMWQ